VNLEERKRVYNQIRNSNNKPLECHICHSELAGRNGNFFCPECRMAVSHESPAHTKARKDFFRYLDDYEEGKSKPLQCMKDERWSGNRLSP